MPSVIDTPAAKQDEVTIVVSEIASHKAPGPDGIPNAALKKALAMPHFAASDDSSPPIILISNSRTKLYTLAKQQWGREWNTGEIGAVVRVLFPEPMKAKFLIHEISTSGEFRRHSDGDYQVSGPQLSGHVG